ncbi:MAG: hypothetical protein J5J06_09275 [Phycisphaerae bacterium]|nr:hypothetical protein [Phycisphaerae bacterium]
MQFQVSGAFRDSGEDVSVTVTAGDYLEAERYAHRLGIMVLRIEPVVPARAVPPVERQPVSHAYEPSYAPPKVQTIEHTGKSLKFGMLVGGCMAMGSPFGCLLQDGESTGVLLALVLFVGGVMIMVMFRLLAWWEHG